MKIVWGTTLKTNAEHIPLVERIEGEEEDCEHSPCWVLWQYESSRNTIEERLKTLAAMLKHGQINACIKLQATGAVPRLDSLLLLSSRILTIQVCQEANTWNEIRRAQNLLDEMPVKYKRGGRKSRQWELSDKYRSYTWKG